MSSAPFELEGRRYLLGIFRDITERNEAEKALKEAIDIINKSSSVAFIWKNQEGWPVEFVSENCEILLGYTAEEFMKGKIAYVDCIHSADFQRVAEEVIKYSSKEEIAEFIHEPYRIIAKDGSEKIIHDWTYIVRDNDGSITHYKGIVEDITKRTLEEKMRKDLESQLHHAQKVQSIGTLAGGIAHDFNNILASIIGYTELSLDDVEKGTLLEENLQEVYSAGKRAKDLVRQLLTFARQSDEKMKPISVDMIVKDALKFIRSSIPTTIEIKQNIDSNSFIMGNATQVHQIFMNLCTNAAHAMEDKGGILEVTLKDVAIDGDINGNMLTLKRGNYIEIKVSDTGTGIDHEIIGSIFDPYFTTKGPGEGTGLGLAVVHGIIESYGGKITVKSELGKGAVFTIFLPITKERQTHRPYEPEDLPGGSERILFLDDEAQIAKMGSRILERLGYSVTARSSSVEALELFRSNPNGFDLVITDMTMPSMTGDKLAIELMKIRSDIPIILCTGYSKKLSYETASEIGIKAFAYKPIVKADLAKTVRKVLDEAK